jgi:hypothetical protein
VDERALNPVAGKSLVIYLRKPAHGSTAQIEDLPEYALRRHELPAVPGGC